MQSQVRRNLTHLSTQHKQKIGEASGKGSLWTDGFHSSVDKRERTNKKVHPGLIPQGSESKLARDVLPVARH